MNMTVREIKSLMKGVQKISKLRKSELVEVVLNRYHYAVSIIKVLDPEVRERYSLVDIPDNPTTDDLIRIDHQLYKCLIDPSKFIYRSKPSSEGSRTSCNAPEELPGGSLLV